MSFYYVDTSALTKHYVAETGSEWVEATIFRPVDNVLLISRITQPSLGASQFGFPDLRFSR